MYTAIKTFVVVVVQQSFVVYSTFLSQNTVKHQIQTRKLTHRIRIHKILQKTAWM